MRALIAMSGGVDSSVAALLVQRMGYECVGVTMRLFGESHGVADDAAQVAAKLGNSATYIYKYFENKEELYLCILADGYQRLYDFLAESVSQYSEPLKRFEATSVAYIEFALGNYPQFHLMYGSRLKKCSDYFGTPSEESAILERDIAYKTRSLMLSIITECLPELNEEECLILLGLVRCSLYGTIHLYKNNIMREANFDFEAVKKELVGELTSIIERRMVAGAC